MAYLSPPLTIIDNQSNSHPSIVSVPPAATWFDEDRQHFVALKGVPKAGWAADSIASGSVDYSELAGAFYSGATSEEYETDAEIVHYQAFGLPHDVSSDEPEKLNEAQSAFDAAKKAARGRNSLVTEVSVAFPLPRKLASVQSNDDSSSIDAGSSVIRRIPLLAKFSEESIHGARYLALQFTSTMVRIINVQNLETPRGEEKHWTIDLSYDIHPVLSSPDKLPFFREGRDINTAIIGGGIIWCRGLNNSINLILITTTAVIVYVMDSQTRTMKKSRVYPHQPATSFWFEAKSRVLVIGSYISNKSDDGNFPKIVVEMKTLFFTENGNIETLPPFVVGSLREARDEGGVDASARSESSDRRDVVSPTDISLVYLHGHVFCVELGSLGSRRGIGFIKMDRANRCIHVRQHETYRLANESSQAELPLVGVVDNLLCIINKESKCTSFLDVHALFSDDQYMLKEIMGVTCPSEPSGVGIHDESLSFLAPNFFLHTDGEGLLYEIKLDINVLLQSIPLTACIVPFLLRRSETKQTMMACIVERLDELIEKKDLPTLKIWLGVVAREYSKSEEATKWDLESADGLLLSASSLLQPDEVSILNGIIVSPPSCRNVFTQAEMLHLVLLRHATLAINAQKTDSKYLDFVSSVAIQYLIEIERRSTPCYTLQCLIVALLVRQARESELISYLTARETQWIQLRRKRQMNLPAPSGIHLDHPKSAIAFSEIMFKIADACSCASMQQRLISHATSILIECNANTIAVRYLLLAGLIEDAIAVCSKKTRSQKDTCGENDTIQAIHFFNATTNKARAMTSEAEKCKLFYHLQHFLHQNFPDAFTRESRKVKAARRSSTGRRASFTGGNNDTVLVEQSKLGHECKFPDELFGGSSSSLCIRIRTMFGYFNSVKP